MQHNIRPLDGITVISLEHAIAAPFCTRQLADLGARVIKIERPKVGDFARGYDQRVNGLASHFVWTNRSKESLTLDVKHAQAQPIMESLLAKADVLVQNLAPGAAERLGLGFETLHKKYPQLIVCNISGYGDGGSYTNKKAYDLLVQSEGGFLSVTGGSGEHEMAKAGCSIADIAAGMYAYSGILAALQLRQKTNKGSELDVSMLESLVEWMGYPLYYAYQQQTPPERTGAAHATIYPYGPFAIGSKGTVMLGLQNEREWQAFCMDVLQQPELLDEEKFSSNFARSGNREELKKIILECFAQLSVAEVLQRLNDAGIANAQVNDMEQVWQHPQLKERKSWRDVQTSAGTIPALLPPARNNNFEPRMDPIPDLGEHNNSLLAELGYTAQQVTELTKNNVI